IEGKENFPKQGAHVYTPTHQSMLDSLLIGVLSNRDIRYMAKIQVFQGLMGKLTAWGGAFPVDREHPSPRSLQHAIDILKQKKGFCLFPEGGIVDNEKYGQ